MEEVTLISDFALLAPAAPALVVIKITPFLPAVPYRLAAAKPLSTLTLAMELGSRSKNLLDPTLPSMASPWVLVSELNGTPSTINNGWLDPEIEVNPRIIMLVAEPDTPLAALISTPEALPFSTLPTSPSAFCSKSSAPTEETA